MTERTALYRHFDAAGRLLYVGISRSVAARASCHKSRSPWFGQVVRTDVEWFPMRLDAETAERKAIRTERPLYNLMHTAQHAPGTAGAIIALWPNRAEFASDCGASLDAVHAWVKRKRISGDYSFARSQTKIAEIKGVSASCIGRVLRRERWRHI